MALLAVALLIVPQAATFLVPKSVRQIEVGMAVDSVESLIPSRFKRHTFTDLLDPSWPRFSEARDWEVIQIQVNERRQNYHIQGGNFLCSWKFLVRFESGRVANIERSSYPWYERMIDRLL